jgi:hypothetical protein
MFERFDKDRFVRAYVQSQKLHATTYAADGKALFESVGLETSGSISEKKGQIQLYGFGTPVLKARTTRLPGAPVVVEDHTHSADPNDRRWRGTVEKLKSKKPSRQTNERGPCRQTKKVKFPPVSETNTINPASKKRSISVGSDEDGRAARMLRFLWPRKAFSSSPLYLGLTERRDRKRARRDIVQPKGSEVTEDIENNSQPKRHSTCKSKKLKQCKMSAGLALMHGFTATNVGKNRLTVS